MPDLSVTSGTGWRNADVGLNAADHRPKYRFRSLLGICQHRKASRHHHTSHIWTCRVDFLSTISRVDVQGVSTTSVMDVHVQGVFSPRAGCFRLSTSLSSFCKCRTVRHPVCPVPDWKRMHMRDPVRYRNKGTQSGTGLRCRKPECRWQPWCRWTAIYKSIK